MLKTLLVSEHRLLREGIAHLLREEESVASVSEAATCEEALEQIREDPPEVVLVYVGDPVGKQMRVLYSLRKKAPDIPVVLLLSAVQDEVITIAMQTGVAGCLDKAVAGDELVRALHDAASGELALSERFAHGLARVFVASTKDGAGQRCPNALTRREMEVLALLAHGFTNRKIASSLFVSESTVRAHLRAATQKLGAHNRVRAVARALELGIVPPSDPSEGATPPHEQRPRLAGA